MAERRRLEDFTPEELQGVTAICASPATVARMIDVAGAPPCCTNSSPILALLALSRIKLLSVPFLDDDEWVLVKEGYEPLAAFTTDSFFRKRPLSPPPSFLLMDDLAAGDPPSPAVRAAGERWLNEGLL
jgi:hypothetical protein